MPFAELDNSIIGAEPHQAAAREMAAKGAVLLKNEGVRRGSRRFLFCQGMY